MIHFSELKLKLSVIFPQGALDVPAGTCIGVRGVHFSMNCDICFSLKAFSLLTFTCFGGVATRVGGGHSFVRVHVKLTQSKLVLHYTCCLHGSLLSLLVASNWEKIRNVGSFDSFPHRSMNIWRLGQRNSSLNGVGRRRRR